MAPENEKTHSIYEARTEKMVSLKDGKSTPRNARFLNPCAKTINQAMKIPNTPLLCELIPHNLQQWPPTKVLFKGWRMPQKYWKEWVDKLSVRYGAIWEQTGICDAIMSSIYEVRCNRDLVLGLLEFWCSETNTFAFPWGEATITLEDAMILGGLPVLGEAVARPLMGDLVKIEEELNKKRIEMSKGKEKKASYSAWMNHFVGREGDDLEHVAFLSLWLSRYVFPSLPEETLGKHVFPIAVHLSRGTPMALAPAVLASLYQNLRLLKEHAIKSLETIVVLGPFQLVQLWALEHFPLLGPCLPNSLQPGEPRVARWHKLSSKIALPLVRSVLKQEENFQWRPYAANVMNWRHLSFYKEVEEVRYHCLNLDEDLQSFVQCLCPCKLTGLYCIEKYMPHRVAMQFGFDQDVPADISCFDLDCKNVGFFVPARTFEPEVSARYFDWWKKTKLTREEAIKDVMMQRKSLKVRSSVMSPLVEGENDNEELNSFASRSLNECKSLAVPIKSNMKQNLVKPIFFSGIMEENLSEDDIPLSLRFPKNAANRTTQKSSVYQLDLAEKKEDHAQSSVVSKSFISPKLLQVSRKVKSEESCVFVAPESSSNGNKQMLQSCCDDDHIPLAVRLKELALCANRKGPHKVHPCNQLQQVTCPTSKETITERSKGIRRLADRVGGDVKSKDSNSTNDQDGISKKVRRNAIISTDDPVHIDNLNKEIKKGQSSKGSVRGEAKAGKTIKVRKFINKPNIDYCMQTTKEGSNQKLGIDLEGRVKKLEQILGVTLDG